MSIAILRNVFYLGEQCVNKWLLRVKWCGKIEKIKEKLNRKREIPKLKYYPNAFCELMIQMNKNYKFFTSTVC